MVKSPLPKRLKALRKEFGLSQMGLGAIIGIDEASSSARISQYESGVHAPDYATLKKFANHYGVSVAYFYAEDEALAQLIRQSGLN